MSDKIIDAEMALWRVGNLARAALHTMEGGGLFQTNSPDKDRQRAADVVADVLRVIRDEADAMANKLSGVCEGGQS